MGTFFMFLLLLGATYLLWRITDQLPDLVFRMSEIQRDVAEIRRRLAEDATADNSTAPAETTSGGPSDDADEAQESDGE